MLSWFRHCKALAPCIPGPWMSYRHYAAERMMEMGVRPGDIVCRLGNAYIGGFFWFSKFIAKVTHSGYSHAAMVVSVDDEIVLMEISTNGISRHYVAEWTDEVWGNDILIMRYAGDPVVARAAAENVKALLKRTIAYDNRFGEEDKFYCTELIHWAYHRVGIHLCDTIPIRELPGWKRRYNGIAWLNGIDPRTPVWCVGNDKIGILSSPDLQRVGKIVLPGYRQPRRKALQFAGA